MIPTQHILWSFPYDTWDIFPPVLHQNLFILNLPIYPPHFMCLSPQDLLSGLKAPTSYSYPLSPLSFIWVSPSSSSTSCWQLLRTQTTSTLIRGEQPRYFSLVYVWVTWIKGYHGKRYSLFLAFQKFALFHFTFTKDLH